MTSPGREGAASQPMAIGDRPKRALELMRQALGLLDDHGDPEDVGAMLDQCICRLENWIARQAA